MKKIIFLLLFSLNSFLLLSQRTCGTMDKLHERMQADPAFAKRHQEMMSFIQDPNNPQTLFRQPNSPNIIVTIPVVFHVLYKNQAQNISDAQIQSQLDVLNKDFRKLNTDFTTVVPSVFRPLAADMEIVFCKATKTPSGVATTGITRKQVSASFDLINNYYDNTGELSWDPTKYLNIWIGRFLEDYILGQALLPPNSGDQPYPGDGLVIGDQFFGTTGTATTPPFNKGRTATHEIGHYFGLYHPWGRGFTDNSNCSDNDNSDLVNDTPAINQAHYGCPAFPTNLNTCSSSTNGAMYMNYMDYVDDACMAMFSNGQKTIVQNTLAGPRLSLLTSNGCGTLGLNDFQAINAIAVYPNPVSQYFMITSPQLAIDEVEIYNTLGQLVKNQKLTQSNNVINIEELASGTYYLRIYNEGKFLKSDKVIKK